MGTKEQGDGIFFISKGTVVLEDEEDYTLFTIVEGNHFGHSAVGRNERRALKARAATECQVFCFFFVFYFFVFIFVFVFLFFVFSFFLVLFLGFSVFCFLLLFILLFCFVILFS